MKWLLSLLIVVIAASLGLWVLQDPGKIIITWLGYEVQLSVFSGFILFLILIFLGFIFFRLFYFLKSTACSCVLFFRSSKDKKEDHELPSNK